MRSSWVKVAAQSRLTTIAAKIHSVARTRRGSGAARISEVSDWKSRITLSGVALRDARPERNNFMRSGPSGVVQLPVLLLPQTGVDVATFEQVFVTADVVDAAAFEHEDRIRGHQRRQPVRDDDQ